MKYSIKMKMRLPHNNYDPLLVLDYENRCDRNSIENHLVNRKSALLCSSFDLLHPGHIRVMEIVKDVFHNELIVGFNVNPEGKNPTQSVFERWKQLEAVKYIDKIIPYSSEEDLLKLLKCTDYDLRVLGDDYVGKHHTGIDYEDSLEIPTLYLDRSHGFSTSGLKEKIKSQS